MTNKIEYQNIKSAKNFVLIPLGIIFILSSLSIFTWIFGKSFGSFEIDIHFKQNTALAFFLISVSSFLLWLKSEKKSINYSCWL